MLCNKRNLKRPPQKAALSDPILVETAIQQLFKPSTPPLTYFLSSSPPPPSFPPHHILASLAFTRLLLPIFLWFFLPHFLPFYRMGRTNPRIQSETQDLSTAGLPPQKPRQGYLKLFHCCGFCSFYRTNTSSLETTSTTADCTHPSYNS